MVTAFVRTILLYFIIMLGLRLMGKRQIGELEPTELVLTMYLAVFDVLNLRVAGNQRCSNIRIINCATHR